jgi:CheY-like chemotaxis protein
LIRLARGESAAWALPVTATEEDRLLATAAAGGGKRSGLVLVYAHEKPQADWLVAACRLRGYTAVHVTSAAAAQGTVPIFAPAKMGLSPLTVGMEGAVAVIFDGGEFGQREADELCSLAAAMPPAPIVALLEFPRIEDYRRALACGARAILSKPLLVDDLFWQLDQFYAEGVPYHSPG